jgi:NAD(P)-dependent dehydrogenase (short-subunit alcohol dehydrogenase family)
MKTNTKFTMKSSFAGKVVLITGGTSGIGRATAVAFAEQGANVVVAGRRTAEGAESVRLVEKTGGNSLFIRTDVAIEKEVEAMVARTVEYFGRLDFAFNNAGIGEMDLGKGIANTNEIFNRIMDTNVRGVFFSLKYEIPAILKSGGGAIVNNASVAGLRAIGPGTPIYTASKFAVVGLTRSVALEFAAKGVRVNAVCPAIIETEMTESFRANHEVRARLMALHQSTGLGNRKKLRQRYSFSARRELHSSPELRCRWTVVFSRKLGSFERLYTRSEVTEGRPDPTPWRSPARIWLPQQSSSLCSKMLTAKGASRPWPDRVGLSVGSPDR